MKDSTKNPKPIAPASTEPSTASAKVRNASAEGTGNNKLVGKKHGKSGNPVTMSAPARSKTTATGGARYGISVKLPSHQEPSAGATQGNGRIIPAAVNRSKPNFAAGMAE